MITAIQDNDIDTVIIGLPNHLHTEVMPDGTTKQILKDPETGKISEEYI